MKGWHKGQKVTNTIALTGVKDQGVVSELVPANSKGYVFAVFDDYIQVWFDLDPANSHTFTMPEKFLKPINQVQLTPREDQILGLIAKGLTNAEIGQALGISPQTIKNHITSILGKTGRRNRVELAVWRVRAERQSE